MGVRHIPVIVLALRSEIRARSRIHTVFYPDRIRTVFHEGEVGVIGYVAILDVGAGPDDDRHIVLLADMPTTARVSDKRRVARDTLHVREAVLH